MFFPLSTFLMKVVDHLECCAHYAAFTLPHKYIYPLPHNYPHLYPAVLIFMAREAIVLACDVTARLIHPQLLDRGYISGVSKLFCFWKMHAY